MTTPRFIMTLMLAAILFAATSCSDDDNDTPCTESIFFEDSDGDGLGNPDVSISSCVQPEGFVENSDDNDDNTDPNVSSSTIWTGDVITFTKEGDTDWTLEDNQDRLTPNVWLTRQNSGGLFNIAAEESNQSNQNQQACNGSLPSDTEWALGTTADIESLTFAPLGDVIGCNFNMIVDQGDMVLHLISDDIFIDINFTAWAGQASGGEFSYERSTMN